MLTENVDINGGRGTTAAVGGLNNVSGTVISLGLGDGDSGVSRLCVDGHPVICVEDQVGLGPFHTGLWLSSHLGWEFNLFASLGGQTSQQLGIQLDLWRLCTDT